MKKAKKNEEENDLTVYDSEDVEEMLEDDELEPKEAGFMEGYNQKQSNKPKKIKKITRGK